MKKIVKFGFLTSALAMIFCVTLLFTACGSTTAELNSQIETLQAQNKTLRDQNVELTADRNSYKTQNETLQAQNETLTNQNNTLITQNQTLTGANSTLQTQNESLQAQNGTLQAQNQSLQTQNETMLAQNETLTNQNNTLTSQNQTLTTQNNTLTSQNQTLTSQNETLTNQNNTLTSQNQTLTEQNETLTTQNQTLTSQNESLTNQNNTLTSQNQTLTEQNETLTTQNQTLTTQNQTQTTQITNLESAKAILNTEINASFKDVLYYSAKLINAGNYNTNFNMIVDLGKKLYLALGEQEINFGEVYKVIVQDGENTTEIPFKLDYATGKYHVYFLTQNNNEPYINRHTFTYVNGKIKRFDVYGNSGGWVYGTYEDINGYSCNAAPGWAGEPVYVAADMRAELGAEIAADHQITITQAQITALEAELNS